MSKANTKWQIYRDALLPPLQALEGALVMSEFQHRDAIALQFGSLVQYLSKAANNSCTLGFKSY